MGFVAPTTSDNAPSGWQQAANVTITLTPTDATSGVASTVYCIDHANTCSPGTSYTVPFSVGGQGDWYVRYYSTDNAGNVQTTVSKHVQVDNVAPTTSGAITSGTLGLASWYTTSVGYTITPADATSGVASTVYCTDTTNACVPSTPYTVPLTLSVQGNNYVRFASTDNAGNVQATQSSGLIKIDTVNPTTSITSPSDNTYSTSTTVALTGTSADTNLASTTISVNSGEFVATGGTPAAWTYSATGLSQGAHTFPV